MASQSSKRARKIRKQAKAAGLPGWFGHPSHVAGKRYVRAWRDRREKANA